MSYEAMKEFVLHPQKKTYQSKENSMRNSIKICW